MTGPSCFNSPAASRTAAAILRDEHAALLLGVKTRAAAVTKSLQQGRWPQHDLGSLVSYLRNSLLRQASDAEVRLFPPDPCLAPFAELAADHRRLRALTSELDGIQRDRCEPERLRTLIGDLLTTLERHLFDKHALLAGQPADITELGGTYDRPVASDARAGAGDLDDPVVLCLDGMPRRDAVQGCIERVLRLRPGQRAELHATDPSRLENVESWMEEFDSAGYGRVRAGADGQTLQITRRFDD